MKITAITKTISLLLFSALLACKTNSETRMIMKPIQSKDIHSFSEPNQARVTHLQWNAVIDFDSKTIHAKATWRIETADDADILLLDTKDLIIERVTLNGNTPAEYKLSENDSILGQALAILLQPGVSQVTITYKTSPGAEALQWLSKEQTAGKTQPFLFTQSQAILARSWVPCQDSPGIRFTYNATVRVPANLLALMSAANPKEKNPEGVYHFEMNQPIPSYLLALAVGDITYKPISNRSGIYAEPALIDTATWEFADLEKMIAGAEELYGKYQWEQYDVLVLPPSFPFGGMENPRLTFATPTILAGDRSLTSLIAHELAHSWSGNLVTNATWNDFWLNEGFTVYFETRIMEKLYGEPYGEMLAALNLHELKEEIKTMEADNLKEDTKLFLNLKDRSPDDGVTSIAYNKGYYFLRTIEEQHGGREKFDQFVKDYFAAHAFSVMDTHTFIKFIKQYYQSKFAVVLPDSLFNDWIYTTGLPANHAQPQSTAFEKVDQIVAQWKSEKTISKEVVGAWSTHEWLHFLNSLPQPLTQEQLQVLDQLGNFTNSGNAEIITLWGVIAIRNEYKKAYPKIEQFLITTGRRKFLMPLYTEMIKTVDGKVRAEAIYRMARSNYHFVAVNSLDKLLK